MITEVGAVKVRGGEVLGEFQTLVNPHQRDPAVHRGADRHHQLDGGRGAPRSSRCCRPFLEFARGCVLVAHNAPFDVGFLRHFAEQQGRPWPRVRGARHRQARPPGDHPRRRAQLQALARWPASFRVRAPRPTTGRSSDARATVDVLHGLMERLGGLGVHTLEELQTFIARGSSTAQRRKRHLAEALPHAPGVYLFRDERGRVLYVGTSRDLRTRVRSYFTASETRSRMGEMVGLADAGHRHRVRHRRSRPRSASCA